MLNSFWMESSMSRTRTNSLPSALASGSSQHVSDAGHCGATTNTGYFVWFSGFVQRCVPGMLHSEICFLLSLPTLPAPCSQRTSGYFFFESYVGGMNSRYGNVCPDLFL